MLKAVKAGETKLVFSDPDAESALIAAAVKGIFYNVSPGDFYDRDWAKAYSFLLKAREAGEPVSIELLKRKTGIPAEKCLSLKVPSYADGEACARIVKEKSVLRKLWDCMRNLYSGGSVDDSLDRALELIRAYKSAGSKNTFVRAADVIEESLKDADWGMLYGFPQIDAWTRGMHRGELIILAGRPSVGKTTLAVQIAAKISMSGKVAFFSLEMKTEQIVRMAACSVTGMRTEEIAWDEEARKKVERMGLYICDTSAQTPDSLYENALRLKEAVGLDLVVIDYLQLLRTNRRHENREYEISEISRSLKVMAKELDVPVLSLSQMSREVEKRGGRPKLSDLRGSGALEQDADVVLFISRSKKAEKTELILEKHRSGPTGVVEVEFRPEISQFAEIGEVEEDCLP